MASAGSPIPPPPAHRPPRWTPNPAPPARAPPSGGGGLADLATLSARATALSPQREALGEEEPHYEIAGERAETLEAPLRGRLRVLVTTPPDTGGRRVGA